MSDPSISALIVAAGASRRFGAAGKVFFPLCGRPVIGWSLGAYAACSAVREIVVVGRAGDSGRVSALAEHEARACTWHFVEGGAERQDSVRRGLEALGADSDIISIHDAARPGVTPDLIRRTAARAMQTGAAIAAVPARDTVKVCGPDGVIRGTLDRRELWQAATPQAFRAEVIREAFREASRTGLEATDDAALVEALGRKVAVVEMDETIRKITTRADLAALEGMLGGSAASAGRTGFGYDIHVTNSARRLVLGGVEFPEGPGLLGHSDADVVCHAVADALLGAAAMGDIGQHFPNTDPAWKDACSLDLLRRVGEMLLEAGYRVVNVDVTLIAERPKIAPRAGQMRSAMAGALGVDAGQVGLKATTAEGVGPAGRGECMEAHAVAQIVRAEAAKA